MKILFISTDFYGQIGGKSTHILMLIKGLGKLGHKVDLVIPQKNLFTKLIVSGIGRIFDLFGVGIFVRRFLIRKLLNISILKMVKRDKFDVVNAEDPDAVLAIYGISTKIPIVLTVHGELARELKAAGHVKYGFENKLLLNLEKKSYEISDIIVAVDSRIKEHIGSLIHSQKQKVRMIYNFLDVISFNKEIDSLNVKDLKKELGFYAYEKIILVPRRLMVKCGVIFTVKAIEILIEEYKMKNILLLIIGSGPEYKNLLDYVNTHDLQKFVIFKQDVEYYLMPKFYRISDVVLIPSINVYGYKEATSLSAIEAMASKTPVIASNIGGLAELIENNETGILVKEKSAEDIARNIALIFSNRAFKERIVEAAFNHVLQRHHYENATSEFMKAYEKAIENKLWHMR